MRIQNDTGLTILELLIVIAIIGLIGTLGSIKLIGYFGRAKTDTAKLQINQLGLALDLYRLDAQRYPTQNQGLAALLSKPSDVEQWNGPYLKNSGLLQDPWGHQYYYRLPGINGEYDIFSFGSDGKEGGSGEAKDVSS